MKAELLTRYPGNPILKDATDSGNIGELLITRDVAEGIRRF